MRYLVGAAVLVAAFVVAPVVAGRAPAAAREPFTITNDPVNGTITDTMARKTCDGTVSQPWPGPEGGFFKIEVVLYRGSDGRPWVKLYWAGKGPLDIPTTELSVSAQWVTPTVSRNLNFWTTHYAAWPEEGNRLVGTTIDPYGTFELTCH